MSRLFRPSAEFRDLQHMQHDVVKSSLSNLSHFVQICHQLSHFPDKLWCYVKYPPTQKSTNILCWPFRFSENSDKSGPIIQSQEGLLWFLIATPHSWLSLSLQSTLSDDTGNMQSVINHWHGSTTVLPRDPPWLSYIPNENILITLTQPQAKCLGSKLIFTVSGVHA